MKIRIAMSGGVDSTAAALLLRQAGHDCEGAIMLLHDAGEKTEKDIEDARAAAARLALPFRVLDYRAVFRREVEERFVRSYLQAETPSPCIDCNRTLKFGLFLEDALRDGFDAIATGHYARCEKSEDGLYRLRKGLDPAKDQSYMLYTLGQEQLSHVLFPLGSLTKTKVRSIAAAAGLENASRGDSQDICFIPDGDYARFIEENGGLGALPGHFIGTDGRDYGPHKGQYHYTVGQRKGLGIASEAPLFVTALRPEDGAVLLSHGEGLFSREVTAREVRLTGDLPWEGEKRVSARIRYRHSEQPASARLENGLLKLIFDEPQRAVTPGQALVLYDGDEVLGGGTITANRAPALQGGHA